MFDRKLDDCVAAAEIELYCDIVAMMFDGADPDT